MTLPQEETCEEFYLKYFSKEIKKRKSKTNRCCHPINTLITFGVIKYGALAVRGLFNDLDPARVLYYNGNLLN